MSIEAMKQALEALDSDDPSIQLRAAVALRQAIEQAEKQEPSLWFAIGKDGRVKYTTDSDRALKWKQAGSYRLVRDYYTAPVHASDISAERIDETAKDRQGWAMQQMVDENQRLGLYDAPKEWVGFTHEELAWLNEALNLGGRFAVIEAIEAKLKEKNT